MVYSVCQGTATMLPVRTKRAFPRRTWVRVAVEQRANWTAILWDGVEERLADRRGSPNLHMPRAVARSERLVGASFDLRHRPFRGAMLDLRWYRVNLGGLTNAKG